MSVATDHEAVVGLRSFLEHADFRDTELEARIIARSELIRALKDSDMPTEWVRNAWCAYSDQCRLYEEQLDPNSPEATLYRLASQVSQILIYLEAMDAHTSYIVDVRYNIVDILDQLQYYPNLRGVATLDAALRALRDSLPSDL